MHQTQFSEKIPYGGFSQIRSHIDVAGGVVNGTIGTIENIQPNLITVRRLKDNELMCITRIKHYVSLRHSTDIAIREVSFDSGLGNNCSQSSGYDYKQQCICCVGFNILCLGAGLCNTSRVKKSAQLHLLAFNPDNVMIVSNNVRSLYGL